MPFSAPEHRSELAAEAPQAEPARAALVVRRRPASGLRPSQVPARSPQAVLRGSGRPLDAPLREEMENRFDADFSTVRVHADGAARASAAELGARAYTAGEHVVVGGGGADKQTFAHELTHVLQQREGPVAGVPVAGAGPGAALKVSHPRDAQERAAEETAVRVTRATPRGPARSTGRVPADTAARWPRASGSGPAVQRMLDAQWTSAASLKTAEGAACHKFARRVSDFVDEVHKDLFSGKVKGWEGDKIATFVRLLLQSNPMALPWAGNAIEERVYALMKERGMPLEWTPQHSESMGSASFPDIVIHLPGSTNDGLVDITSERFHIDRKAGGWSGASHIYVAEAYFHPVTAEQLPLILANLKKGGVDQETAKKMAAEAAAKRNAAKKVRDAKVAAARKLANKYATGREFIEKEFEGKAKDARKFLLDHGLKKKGVTSTGETKRRKTRKLSEETKRLRSKKVRERRKQIVQPTLDELLEKIGQPAPLSVGAASASEDEREESEDELVDTPEEEEGEEESDDEE